MTLKSTILINEEFKRQGLDAHVINEVHDSIMAEVREDQVVVAARIMRDIMQMVPKEVLQTDMPFVADLELGTHWGDLKKYSLPGET